MNEIYFINKEHERNFKETLMKWQLANKSMEYRTACYILAVPMIFEKVKDYMANFDSPVTWIYLWEYKNTLSDSEDINDCEKENDDEDESNIPYDLTHSMIQLGKFSLNMWNGYGHFNLLDCISVLDATNYNVLKCAMDIRMGRIQND